MDYYSKYQKYKLKFLNLRKQIGGTVIWQCKINENTWADYSHEDSQTIERNHGKIQLPSGYEIHKAQGAHVGTQHGFNKRTGVASERPIRRIQIDDTVAQKLLKTLRAFPVIFTYRVSRDDLRRHLSTLFTDNRERINSIWGLPDSFETLPRSYDEKFLEIINRTTFTMTDEELLKFIEDMLKRISDEGRAEMAGIYKAQKEEEDERERWSALEQ
jgi:hypothetical protein